jgi:hypothetical protein
VVSVRLAAGFATAVATTVVALPGGALAQAPSNPLAPGIPAAPAQTPTASTPTIINPTTTTSGGGLSGTSAIAIAVGALVLLGGISFFIWHDARRRAPVRHRAATATAGDDGRPGSKQKVKPRKLSPAERRRRKRGRAR